MDHPIIDAALDHELREALAAEERHAAILDQQLRQYDMEARLIEGLTHLREREAQLDQREAQLNESSAPLRQREASLQQREERFKEEMALVRQKQAALQRSEAQLNEEMALLCQRQASLQQNEAKLEERAREIRLFERENLNRSVRIHRIACWCACLLCLALFTMTVFFLSKCHTCDDILGSIFENAIFVFGFTALTMSILQSMYRDLRYILGL